MIVSEFEDVMLREFEERDILQKVEWINDPENNQFLHYELPVRVDKTIAWFYSKDNNRRKDCVIEYQGIAVGVIGLLQIDRENSKAEYYITIGNKNYKNKGIATKATYAILDYAFKSLKLHKVYLTVDSENIAAIKLYKKMGFKHEGHFIDDMFSPRKLEFIDRDRFAIIR
jgi:diamine N-acetyltransferase